MTDEVKQKQLHEKDLQRIKNATLLQDDLMSVFFNGNIKDTEELIRIILGRTDLIVRSAVTQREIKSLTGRDIRLDIDAFDNKGNEYNIEIQRLNKGADFRRARYHSSVLDTSLLKHGQEVTDLPETYVIFITEKDFIGEGKPIYFIERQITGLRKPFDDGEHIVYVNGSNRNAETELGRLMHDFSCSNPDDMFNQHFAKTMRYFKETEEGINTMCKELEDMRAEAREEGREEGRAEGRAEGITQNKLEMAKRMLSMGQFTVETIVKACDLPIETVTELAKA